MKSNFSVGPPSGLAARVGLVVVVAVRVRVRVVALRGRELGAGDAVGVMPPERRRERVRGIGHQRALAVVRVLLRELEHAVARPVDDRVRRLGVRAPVVLAQQRAAGGVDRHLPQVPVLGVVDRHLPRQAQAVLRRRVAELGRDRLGRDPARGEHRVARGAWSAARAGPPGASRSSPSAAASTASTASSCALDGAARGQAHEVAAGEDRRGCRVRDVDRRVALEDLQVLVDLPDVDVRDAVVRAAVLVRHGEVGDVRGRHAELAGVVDGVLQRHLTRRLRRRDALRHRRPEQALMREPAAVLVA